MLELFQIYKEGIGNSVVYGKTISLGNTIVFYTPQDNSVTISRSLEKAIGVTLVGFPKPEFLENIPNAIGETIIERPSINGKYLTKINTTQNPNGIVELILEIQEEINKVTTLKNKFILTYNGQFDYDLLKGNKIK